MPAVLPSQLFPDPALTPTSTTQNPCAGDMSICSSPQVQPAGGNSPVPATSHCPSPLIETNILSPATTHRASPSPPVQMDVLPPATSFSPPRTVQTASEKSVPTSTTAIALSPPRKVFVTPTGMENPAPQNVDNLPHCQNVCLPFSWCKLNANRILDARY
jgi:hypothetical protein